MTERNDDQALRSHDALSGQGPRPTPDERPRHILEGESCPLHACRVEPDSLSECGVPACPTCGSSDDLTVREALGGVFHYACADCERSWAQ